MAEDAEEADDTADEETVVLAVEVDEVFVLVLFVEDEDVTARSWIASLGMA